MHGAPPPPRATVCVCRHTGTSHKDSNINRAHQLHKDTLVAKYVMGEEQMRLAMQQDMAKLSVRLFADLPNECQGCACTCAAWDVSVGAAAVCQSGNASDWQSSPSLEGPLRFTVHLWRDPSDSLTCGDPPPPCEAACGDPPPPCEAACSGCSSPRK